MKSQLSAAEEKSLPEESDYNVLFCSGGSILKDSVIMGAGNTFYKDWQEHGFDKHSIVTDPLFVNYENDNYSLKPESPAFKLGFEPIDLSSVGLRGRKLK